MLSITLERITKTGKHSHEKITFPDKTDRYNQENVNYDQYVLDLTVRDILKIRDSIEELTHITTITIDDKDYTKRDLPLLINSIETWTGDLELPFNRYRLDRPQRKTVTKHYRNNEVSQI